jgi:hypothetical protein
MGPKNLVNHDEPSDQEQHLVIGNVRDRLIALCTSRMGEGTNDYATDVDTIWPSEVLEILGVRVSNDMLVPLPEPPAEREPIPDDEPAWPEGEHNPSAPVERGKASEGMSVVVTPADESERPATPSEARKSQGSTSRTTRRPQGGGSGHAKS